MSRSIDKLLHKGSSGFDEPRFGGNDYPNELAGLARGRGDQFNHPTISDYRGT